MIAGQGLFQLTTRSESYRSQTSLKAPAVTFGDSRSDKPSVLLPPGLASDSSSMGAFWQNAAKTASAHLPSDHTINKLQEASKSDNKEVTAQKMEQAKAKLQALRMQAQLAAASGDKQTLKRIAQEVASAARDVASAARDLAGGISASVSDATGTASSLPVAAGAAAGNGAAPNSAQAGQPQTAKPEGAAAAGTGAATTAAPEAPAADDNFQPQAGTTASQPDKAVRNLPIYAQEPPSDEGPQAWEQKALRALSDDAGTAIAQAKGLLAFLSNAARARRKPGERDDDDQFFRELSRSVDAAEHDMTGAITAAGREILTASAPDTGSMTITTVTTTQATVEVSQSVNITA